MPRRRETAGQATAGSVLDRIDSVTAEECACGCGTRLAVDGPSAWFAAESCQRAWQAGQAGAEAERPARPWATVRAEGEAVMAAQRMLDRREMFNWRRLCPTCHQRREPRDVGEEPIDVTGFSREELARLLDRDRAAGLNGPSMSYPHPPVRQDCRNCGYTWPGSPIQASVMYDYTREHEFAQLRMESEGHAASMTVRVAHLAGLPAPYEYIDHAWDTLELQLAQMLAQGAMDERMRGWQRAWEGMMRFSVHVMDPNVIFRAGGE